MVLLQKLRKLAANQKNRNKRLNKKSYESEPEEMLKIFLSGQEVVQACKFQHKFKNKNTELSKFVTVVIHEDQNEPTTAFMISDQGVAMVSAGLVGASTKEDGKLTVMKPEEGYYHPAVVVEQKSVKPGDTFDPSVMLITLEVTMIPEITFKYVDVYHKATQNKTIPARPDKSLVNNLVFNASRVNLKYHERLSDFILLLHLNEFISDDLAALVASSVVQKRSVKGSDKLRLDQAFKAL